MCGGEECVPSQGHCLIQGTTCTGRALPAPPPSLCCRKQPVLLGVLWGVLRALRMPGGCGCDGARVARLCLPGMLSPSYVVFISSHAGMHVSLLCVGTVCVDAVPSGCSSWAGHIPGSEAVHCSQPDPGGFVCPAGSPCGPIGKAATSPVELHYAKG